MRQRREQRRFSGQGSGRANAGNAWFPLEAKRADHNRRVAYNEQQWIESFEGQLSLLKPHLTERVLATMSHMAWQQYGRKDEDPISAAKAWVAELGAQAAAAPAPPAAKKTVSKKK